MNGAAPDRRRTRRGPAPSRARSSDPNRRWLLSGHRRQQAGIGGVPLTTAEDTVVAAVRLAYKVADAQIEHSMRLAQRLRTAGDRQAGEHERPQSV